MMPGALGIGMKLENSFIVIIVTASDVNVIYKLIKEP